MKTFNIAKEPEIRLDDTAVQDDGGEWWRRTGRVAITVTSATGKLLFKEMFETHDEAEAVWRALIALQKECV